MLLIIHVLLALSSLVCSGFALLAPSKTKLRTSYELTALTLVSGTYLVLHTHAPLTRSCLSGLAYLGVISIEIFAARRRLASVQS